MLAGLALQTPPTGTLTVNGKLRPVIEVQAGTHEYKSAEIYLGTERAWGGQGLLLEVPIRTGDYSLVGLLSETSGTMRFRNASIGVDAVSWDSATKPFMKKAEGEKPGTGLAKVRFRVVGETDKEVQTRIDGTYEATLRGTDENGTLHEWKVVGTIKDLPFPVPKQYWPGSNAN